MGTTIHRTAIMGDAVEIGDGCTIGPYVVVDSGAVLGANNHLAAGCYVSGQVRLGHRNRLMHGVCLGSEPQSLGDRGEHTHLVVGDDNWFGEYVTIHRGTTHTGKTSVGNHNYVMAYSHIGHDCRIGNQVIMANNVNLAGHVQVMDRANIGGGVAVHQFTRIGELTMIGGLSGIGQDLLPFTLAACRNMTFGLNRIGIQRSAYATEARGPLRIAYRRFCIQREPLDAFLAWLEGQPWNAFLQVWIQFLSARSQRGYIRRHGASRDTRQM
jgi:UDP-N-acetylglucosamine acyltransferase